MQIKKMRVDFLVSVVIANNTNGSGECKWCNSRI